MTVSGVAKKENIIINKANENNLKNVTVNIPINDFTCITGPSGCGKSSLVFDTIYAESQRNFLESMSFNLFGQKLMNKPKVESIENLKPALKLSQNYYNVNPRSTIGTITDLSYYLRTIFALIYSDVNKVHVDMNYFSSNNPTSCCKHCDGTGEEYVLAEEMVIPDKNKKLSEGAILYYKGNKSSLEFKLLEKICDHYNIDIELPFNKLKKKQINDLLYRNEKVVFEINFKNQKGKHRKKKVSSIGAMNELSNKLKDVSIPSVYQSISKYIKKAKCSYCDGQKLKQKLLDFKICDKNISDVEDLALIEIQNWLKTVKEKYEKNAYFQQLNQLSDSIEERIKKMIEINLGYLSLGRSVPTLSGGEIQRVRISNQLNCSLNGILYILDEPCRGLHYKNVLSIINATKELVNKGNTVIAIEHNKQYIVESDKIIDMGPRGGKDGGYIVDTDFDKKKIKNNISFKKPRAIEEYIHLINVNYNNLKDVSFVIPCKCVTCITGVSGSGKSSLISVLSKSISQGKAINCEKIEVPSKLEKVVRVDQQPIGKNPRSTVVSYLEIYDNLRDIFASTDMAKKHKLTPTEFSMNVPGGRCEVCQGTGMKKIELQYLSDSYIECPECKGKRFNELVLSCVYNGLNIAQVLDSPISDLISIFEKHKNILSMLNFMDKIGLGYLSLGQMSMTLSGGEAQRVKLAKALGTNHKDKRLYILDEPTSGLNEKDIIKIKDLLNALVDNGHTIVIVEHNLEFIAEISDYIVDLGSKAGKERKSFIVEGKPTEVVKNKKSSWYNFEKYMI